MSTRRGRGGLYGVLAALVVLEFSLSPWLSGLGESPDFLLLALLIYSMRARPGAAALAGFFFGIISDSVSPVAFGSGVIGYSVVGYLAAWGRAVFFAENIIVNAAFFFGGSWFSDLLVMSASGFRLTTIFWRLISWSIWEGILTAGFGVLVLVLFRDWINIRIAD